LDLYSVYFFDGVNGWAAGSNGLIIKYTASTFVNNNIKNDQQTEYTLLQNYPNPANQTTLISYNLHKRTKVTLQIYNIYGQLVKILVDELQSAGYHTIYWDGYDNKGIKVSSGTYLYHIKTNEFSESRKMVIIQ
ncbi:T9SS type A sorting domain-containing protein, partial [bacterium]|nr:T9SS type A sorting domain-containing protein [bacterium]